MKLLFVLHFKQYVCSRNDSASERIFIYAGETKEELENSPFSEQLLEKGYEIIYFTDPVDEYVMQNLMEYDDYKFQSASKEDLKLNDKDTKKENKRLKAGLKQHLHVH